MSVYPSWSYYPRNVRPPAWVQEFLAAVSAVEAEISTAEVPADDERMDSDAVLAALRPGLEDLHYLVESGKKASDKINRPVLFGDDGVPQVSYDIDAFHDEHGIAVEVEAGRGAANNADYRDILRTSLLLDASYLALLMPVKYHHKQRGKPMVKTAYANTRGQLNALYASERLRLPFKGVLLVGY